MTVLAIDRYPKGQNPAHLIRAICTHAGVPVSSEVYRDQDGADIRIDLRGTTVLEATYIAELYLLGIGVKYRVLAGGGCGLSTIHTGHGGDDTREGQAESCRGAIG